jgi:hypothetical protein
MNAYVHAADPQEGTQKGIELSEWSWRPVCSIMAVANETIRKRTGNLLLRRDMTEDFEGQHGYAIMETDIVNQIADEMLRLADTPEELESYGVRVEVQNGNFIYTYPTESCTASFEKKSDGELILDPKDYEDDEIRSCFWVSEKQLKETIQFFKTSGGFGLPYCG